MPLDGNQPPERGYAERMHMRREDSHANDYTGIYAPYANRPDTVLELMMPNWFPQSADSGNYADVGNSYVAGMAALQQVFSPAGVGKFVRPRENTWIRHELAVIGGGLDFNTKRYEFDKIVAHFAGIPEAFDPKSRRYEKYADLRMNIAVLRNYLLNHFFPDGDVENDARDRQAAHSLNQVAMQVGEMLHRGRSWLPHLGTSVSPSRANMKGDGAAEIYEKLYRGERLRHLASPVMVPINFLRNRSNMFWRLPPLTETPFDPRNLAAPLDTYATGDDVMTGGGGRPDGMASMPDPARTEVISHSFDDLGAGLAGAAIPLASVDNLSEPVKARAVEIAREILEKLRLKFADTPLDALLDRVDTAEVYKLLQETQKLSDLFYTQAGRAALRDPNLFLDTDIQVAFDSLGKLSAQAKLQALKYAEESGSSENALRIANELQAMPASWRDTGLLTVGQMLGSVQVGLEKILLRLQEQARASNEVRQPVLAGPALGTGLVAGAAGTVLGVGAGMGLANQAGVVAPSIPPLQRQMQQVMAANQIANTAADRRAQSLDSNATSMESALSTAALRAVTPPPRPSSRPRNANRLPSSTVREAGRRAPQQAMAPTPAPATDAFGSLLNNGDMAKMRTAVDTGGLTSPAIGPRRARDVVERIAAQERDPLAQSNDSNGTGRPGGFGVR
jgi:hypothetical protein